MPRRPRMVNVAEETYQRAAAVGELVQVVLANNHRARLFEPPDDFRIFHRYVIFVQGAGGGSPSSRSIDQIFERDGNAVQRSSPLIAPDFSFSSPRFREGGFPGDGNECIQCGIEFRNAIQATPSQFDWRNLLPPQTRGNLGDRF